MITFALLSVMWLSATGPMTAFLSSLKFAICLKLLWMLITDFRMSLHSLFLCWAPAAVSISFCARSIIWLMGGQFTTSFCDSALLSSKNDCKALLTHEAKCVGISSGRYACWMNGGSAPYGSRIYLKTS